ncbi:unnamed protein product [Callosobruchus maculatus]|nr:unnamed protein product [Callosobruchus maculatus]
MIIGKAGNYIKQIKEQSGSYEQNKKACMMILAKVVEDPQSGTCLIVSYADVSGPVANFNPNGSPSRTRRRA